MTIRHTIMLYDRKADSYFIADDAILNPISVR